MSGKNQINGGAFQDCEGNVLANGYLDLQLSHDSQETVDPGQVIGGFSIRVPLDANGNVLGSVFVWPNDQLNPSNSYYTATAYRADGTAAWLYPQYVSILSSPSPYNIGNWVPVNPPGSVGSPVGSILLQTNGVNNTSQSKLNLYSSDSSVTLTSDSAGDVNLQAAGGGGFTVQHAAVTLTSAQLNALVATPQTLVAAPGAGKIIVPIIFTWEYVHGVAAFVLTDATYILAYGNDPGQGSLDAATAVGNWPSNFADQTTSQFAFDAVFSPNAFITLLTSCENSAIVLLNNGSDSTGGSGSTITITVTYYVLTA